MTSLRPSIFVPHSPPRRAASNSLTPAGEMSISITPLSLNPTDISIISKERGNKQRAAKRDFVKIDWPNAFSLPVPPSSSAKLSPADGGHHHEISEPTTRQSRDSRLKAVLHSRKGQTSIEKGNRRSAFQQALPSIPPDAGIPPTVKQVTLNKSRARKNGFKSAE